MDNWLKGLVGAACIAVIGGVLYFVVGDMADRPSETDRILQNHEDVLKRIDAYNNRTP